MSIVEFEKQEIEVSEVANSEDRYRLRKHSSLVPHNGHKVWEVDLGTLEIVPAEYDQLDVKFDPNFKKGSKNSSESKIIMREGKVYIAALNKKSALKKFNKCSTGSKHEGSKGFMRLNIF